MNASWSQPIRQSGAVRAKHHEGLVRKVFLGGTAGRTEPGWSDRTRLVGPNPDCGSWLVARADSALTGDCDGRDREGPASEQCARAGRQRRTGRDDVVDEQDPESRHRPGDRRGTHGGCVAVLRVVAGHDRAAVPQAERTHDIRGSIVAPQFVLGDRRAATLQSESQRQTQVTRRNDGDERSLVITALALSLGVDRHGYDDLGTGPGPRPSAADRGPKWFSQTPFAAVFQVVKGVSDGAGERCAPFQLEERSGQVDGHPDRRAPG